MPFEKAIDPKAKSCRQGTTVSRTKMLAGSKLENLETSIAMHNISFMEPTADDLPANKFLPRFGKAPRSSTHLGQALETL